MDLVIADLMTDSDRMTLAYTECSPHSTSIQKARSFLCLEFQQNRTYIITRVWVVPVSSKKQSFAIFCIIKKFYIVKGSDMLYNANITGTVKVDNEFHQFSYWLTKLSCISCKWYLKLKFPHHRKRTPSSFQRLTGWCSLQHKIPLFIVGTTRTTYIQWPWQTIS
jgi:hypothetical protein